jgi:hypothetical protein
VTVLVIGSGTWGSSAQTSPQARLRELVAKGVGRCYRNLQHRPPTVGSFSSRKPPASIGLLITWSSDMPLIIDQQSLPAT